MKTPLLLIASLMATSAVKAQEDITSQYLSNPSFEADKTSGLTAENNSADGLRGYKLNNPSGWTVAGADVTKLLVTKDCFTDNNFGKVTTVPDGDNAYYLRMGWSTGTSSITQTLTKLPVGKYKLTVQIRTGYANSASSTLSIKGGSAATSVSFEQGSQGFFAVADWNTKEVVFDVKSEGTVVIGTDIAWQSGGSCVMLDNFRLYRLSDDYKEPDEPTEESVTSPTEGVITHDFVQEAEMKADLLQMLANFSKYMVDDWNQCSAPNSIDESCGFFKGENSGGSNEQGVRPNADLSMICAFLAKYGKPAGVKLPSGVTWDKIEEMAMKSLIFAYSTHKANKLKICSGGNYWGSMSKNDNVWESSLWAMSVAYSAYFQWDKLSAAQKGYIEKMLKAECNYELERGIPTGYAGDTKAEENGWEVDILAATLGLFPNDALAPKWFARMREFAINSYSHISDAANTNVIDPEYDNVTIADLYRGANLYDDYTLQNHNLFHTSYQNVVMQELGEAALALKMFQTGLYGTEKWKSNALMHHNQEVMDSVLNWLALADGELAMPNGNDWSLFLYDQITSYSTQACFQRDPHALMLENLAYKYIKARQATTKDGSWLLRADVGARRMGVEAHRVMMTYLMHDVLPTADVKATEWGDFNKMFAESKILPCQNVVRAASDSRFTTFSWSDGLKSYTGYFAANNPDKNKIVVPFRANNTGNFLGWYEVSGKGNNATPVVKGVYQLCGNGYVMNGELNTNDNTLNNRFAIYSTPKNAIIYLDYVTAKAGCTITAEKGGLLAISVDEMTKLSRTLYYNNGDAIAHTQLSGTQFTKIETPWVNIDNEVGVVGVNKGKSVAFGDRSNNNSVMTAKLYPMYSNTSRSVKLGDVVDARGLVYYSNIDAESTAAHSRNLVSLKDMLPQGWNGVIATDDDCAYLIVSNFKGADTEAHIKGLSYMEWAPVFREQTIISDNTAEVILPLVQNNSYAQPVKIMVKGTKLLAQLETETSAYITAEASGEFSVGIAVDGSGTPSRLENHNIKKGETVRVYLNDKNEVCVESASIPSVEKGQDLTSKIVNPSFDGETSVGWSGTTPGFQSYTDAEFFNKNFNIYQTISGLQPGQYAVGVQAFYRDGGYASAANLRTQGKEELNAKLYANDAEVSVKSIFEDANGNYKMGVQTTLGYVPDNMEQAASYFRKGLYRNVVEATVGEDGLLTIGLKKEAAVSSDWTIFDNFTLTYLGNGEDEPDDPVVDPEPEPEPDDPTVDPEPEPDDPTVDPEPEPGPDDPAVDPEPEPEDPVVDSIGTVVVLPENAEFYNLQGHKLNKTLSELTPGIYVVNGKKVLVK